MKKFILTLALTIITTTLLPNIVCNIVQAQEKAVWIDVRTKAEFDTNHLKTAVLVPYNEISKKIAKIVPDKRRRINLYCHTGRRAQIALQTLEALGYLSVQNLGGIKKLQEQGVK